MRDGKISIMAAIVQIMCEHAHRQCTEDIQILNEQTIPKLLTIGKRTVDFEICNPKKK